MSRVTTDAGDFSPEFKALQLLCVKKLKIISKRRETETQQFEPADFFFFF